MTFLALLLMTGIVGIWRFEDVLPEKLGSVYEKETDIR